MKLCRKQKSKNKQKYRDTLFCLDTIKQGILPNLKTEKYWMRSFMKEK